TPVSFITVTSVAVHIHQVTQTEPRSPASGVHRAFTRTALQLFANKEWIDFIIDPYADDFVKANPQTSRIAELDPDYAVLISKFNALGNVGPEWLVSALCRIGAEFTKAEVDAFHEALLSTLGQRIDRLQQSAIPNPDEPVWEPLKIEREDPRYVEAVAAT